MNDYLSEVFGDGGLFASRFPGYEMREGQVALARMVDEAMSRRASRPRRRAVRNRQVGRVLRCRPSTTRTTRRGAW
jgi:hypothetical protein